jgi:hypothetical protein
MIFLTDTCFWSHLKLLFDNSIYDFRDFFELNNWGLTEEVIKEMKHYKLDTFVDIKQASIIPINQKEYDSILDHYPFLKEFDKADQTLIIASQKLNEPILTDDGDLYLNCLSMKIICFLLPLFCLNQCRNGGISKKIMYRCLDFWESHELYKKREINKWYKELQAI